MTLEEVKEAIATGRPRDLHGAIDELLRIREEAMEALDAGDVSDDVLGAIKYCNSVINATKNKKAIKEMTLAALLFDRVADILLDEFSERKPPEHWDQYTSLNVICSDVLGGFDSLACLVYTSLSGNTLCAAEDDILEELRDMLESSAAWGRPGAEAALARFDYLRYNGVPTEADASQEASRLWPDAEWAKGPGDEDEDEDEDEDDGSWDDDDDEDDGSWDDED